MQIKHSKACKWSFVAMNNDGSAQLCYLSDWMGGWVCHRFMSGYNRPSKTTLLNARLIYFNYLRRGIIVSRRKMSKLAKKLIVVRDLLQ